jgi:hypothetical protein
MRTRPARLGDPDADAPEWWRRSANLRKVPIIALIILVVIIFRAGLSGSPPSIRTSCTTPAFVLSTTHTQVRHPLAWTVTGPPGMLYQLTIGIGGFVTSGGKLHATPDSGLTLDQTQYGSPVTTMAGECKQSGHLAVVIKAGTYQVRLFRLHGPRSAPTATPVDVETLTVDPR